jgi:hypothetical protein
MSRRKLLWPLALGVVLALVFATAGPAAPKARYTLQPSPALTGQATMFDASATRCSPGPCSYRWSVLSSARGRRSRPLGRGKILRFVFRRPGVRYVRLRVRNRKGQRSSTTKRIAVSTATAPVVTPSPAPGVSLEEVDGGVGYYGRFAYGLPADASFFPIGVWGAYDQTLANIAKDNAVGLNLYVWPADSTIPISRFEQNGMYALLTSDWYGKPGVATSRANNGYMLNDEVDMEYQRDSVGGRAVMQNAVNAAPKDGRALYTNYGKCVAFWEWCGDDYTGDLVNDYVQLVSDDVYWFTDPWESSRYTQRAFGYGATVDKLRFLDGMDGQRKPIWNFVEVGHPFENTAGDGTARSITPPELRAAVWHSIIAGARGIIYFQHSFGGPCMTHHALRATGTCYAGVQTMVTSVNGQIKALAPVLNAPTVTSGTSTSPTIRTLVKWHAGHFYVFAGSKENQSSTGTVSIPCAANATAVRLGETGTLPVTAGSFSDQFPDGNTIHIYRIDGGSTCGLPAG